MDPNNVSTTQSRQSLWHARHNAEPLVPVQTTVEEPPEVSPHHSDGPTTCRRPDPHPHGTFISQFVRPHLNALPPATHPTTAVPPVAISPPPASVTRSAALPSVSESDSTLSFRKWMESECTALVGQDTERQPLFRTIGAKREVLKKKRSFHRRCVQPLEDDDIDAILLYTSTTMYKTLNIYLREGKVDTNGWKPWVVQLNSAVKKLPRFSGPVFRVLDNNRDTMGYVRGSQVVWDAFTSCSSSLSGSNVKKFGAEDGKPSCTLVVHVHDAAEVGPLNPLGENEILISPGWVGDVVDTVDVKGDTSFARDAGYSTILELVQRNHTRAVTGTQVDQDNFESVLLAAEIRHSGPVHLRNDQVAAEHYERALELNPKSAVACHRYANLLRDRLKKPKRAAEYYERSVKLDPTNACAYSDYTIVLSQDLFQHEKAALCFEKAFQIDPTVVSLTNHFPINLPVDLLEKASRLYDEAVSLNPEYVDLQIRYAQFIRNGCKQPEKAAEVYEKIRREHPHAVNCAVLQNLGSILMDDLQRKAEALDCFKEAVQLDPSNATACYTYAKNLKLVAGDYPKAVEYYERAIRLNDMDFEAIYNFGVLLKEMGQNDRALECFERAIELNPSDPDAYINRGVLLMRCEPRVAANCFQKAIELNPTDADALNNYSILLMDTFHEPMKAIQYNDRALKSCPSHAHALRSRDIYVGQVMKAAMLAFQCCLFIHQGQSAFPQKT